MILHILCREGNGPWRRIGTVDRPDNQVELAAEQEVNRWQSNWARAFEHEFKITGDWK